MGSFREAAALWQVIEAWIDRRRPANDEDADGVHPAEHDEPAAAA